jgi:hypothetical protein
MHKYKCNGCDGKGLTIGACHCKCDRCQGKGYILTGDYCWQCDGTGKRKGSFLGLAKCRVCGGKGIGQMLSCQHCSGRKRNPACERCRGRDVCQECLGAGRFDFLDQLAKLKVVDNRLDSDTYFDSGPVTASEANKLVFERHKEDSWGGFKMYPVRDDGRSLSLLVSQKSSNTSLFVFRIGQAQYRVLGEHRRE